MRTKLQLLADRGAEARCRTIAEELRRLREDAGLSKAAVARVAGIHPSHLGLVESGRREPSASVLGRIAAALGADVSTRIFQSVGPPIRDRFQSRMIEAFLRMLPSHWARFVEVPVHRPVRGVLDAVVGDRVARRVVSIEGQSELRRLEQQFRWASAKSDALPSSAVWPFLAPDPADPPTVSRILLLRSTVATRDVARTFPATLSAAYPADPAALVAALLDSSRPWPGSGIIWVRVEGVQTASSEAGREGSHACLRRDAEPRIVRLRLGSAPAGCFVATDGLDFPGRAARLGLRKLGTSPQNQEWPTLSQEANSRSLRRSVLIATRSATGRRNGSAVASATLLDRTSRSRQRAVAS
jgi:transcriptional regulator with XRE-family HTH domain